MTHSRDSSLLASLVSVYTKVFIASVFYKAKNYKLEIPSIPTSKELVKLW